MVEESSFVYLWTDHKTNKLYVGSHKGTEDDGYVCSSKLMLEQYKERPQDFTREIINKGSLIDMRILEAKILDDIDARNNPQYYNQHNGNGDFYCKGHTKETKQKMSEVKKGKTNSKEHIRKMSDANKGKVLSEKTKKKISDAGRKRKNSEETRKKISISNTGKFCSEESKRKISLANKGNRHTEEARKKISDAGRGRIHSEKTKQKMSEVKKGKTFTTEHKLKLSIAAKKRHRGVEIAQ